MSVSLQAPPTSVRVGSYFVSKEKKLYYVKDVMPDGDHVLVENCMNNRAKWWTIASFNHVRRHYLEREEVNQADA